jgi:hypothetical protein
MDANPSILVVLPDDLLSHLRRVAQEKHVPLRWLVAGLVGCDRASAKDFHEIRAVFTRGVA